MVSLEAYQMLESTGLTLVHRIDGKLSMPALDRYEGGLYKQENMPDFKSIIRRQTNGVDQPKLLILSALYGPLHPEILIHSYDLKMPQNGKPWHTVFPKFLKDYVVRNDIRKIRIFVGGSTGYYNVLASSIQYLIKQDILPKGRSIHYQVVNGGSATTGPNHRRQLVKLLEPNYPKLQAMFNRKIEENYF